MDKFCRILEKSCLSKRTDGVDCFWGGDDYDGMISKIYEIPVYSFNFSLEPTQEIISIHQDELGVFDENPEMKKLYELLFGRMARGTKIMVPKMKTVLSVKINHEPTCMENGKMIGHIYKNDHFNAVISTNQHFQKEQQQEHQQEKLKEQVMEKKIVKKKELVKKSLRRSPRRKL